jgi:hypothetical protein
METKIVFVSGAEVRVHEEMESVRDKLISESRSWPRVDRGGTGPHPVCVNPANVAYLESVPDLEPTPSEPA